MPLPFDLGSLLGNQGFMGQQSFNSAVPQSFFDFLNQGGGARVNTERASNALSQMLNYLFTQGTGQLAPTGFANLQSILQSQGATPPDLLNRELADIARTTQGDVRSIQAQLARQGLGASGLGQTLSAARQFGGAGLRAQRLAQETATQEERRRQDLNLLYSLLGLASSQPELIGTFQNTPKFGNILGPQLLAGALQGIPMLGGLG